MKKNNATENGGIIYNVTIKVAAGIAPQWLTWLLQEHIPEVIATGCFTNYRVLKILETDEEGPTYAIQYNAPAIKDYERYIKMYAADLRQKSIDKWGDHFIAFRTIMEIVK